MKKLLTILLTALLFIQIDAQAQNKEYKNAIQAKIGLNDFGLLNDTSMRLGQHFEIGYFRNISPYINIGVPFKLGVAKLPGQVNNTVTTSADLVVHLSNTASTSKIIPYAFAGGGFFMEDFENGHLQIPFGAGINLKVSKYAFVNVQAEFRKALEDNRDNLQLGVGFVYLLHKPDPSTIDTDKDGTPDVMDKCPGKPGPKSSLGCPDTDADGLSDAEDQCPEVAGVLETNGCPDADADGVPDKDDECPEVAGTLNGCPDTDRDGLVDGKDNCPDLFGPIANNGCPETKDTDGDGFADDADDCPTLAGANKGCPDTDGDGISDNFDKCPDKPGTVDNEGCPKAADPDTDGDGVADKDDPCPTVSGQFGGCPDSDGDGVADHLDSCPDKSGPASNKGCPVPTAPDTDGDGVADKDDPCPAIPGKFAGCPDTDSDGLADNLDKCPNTPGLATNNGCPEIKKEVKERLEFATKAVKFEPSKAVLKVESYAILDEIVEILRKYPEYKLSISGHTDNTGDDDENMELSQDRAKACYDYLVFRGIKTERLRFAGFGENRPVADNKTAEGREKNRRVEFEIIQD